MINEEYPTLPKEIEKYVEKPYGGLFGDTVQAKVVEEIIADPYYIYRPKDLEEMTGKSSPSIRRALNTLTSLNLLIKDESDRQHPRYEVNFESKKLVALSFLAYASLDDRDNSDHMNDAIFNYCMSNLEDKIQPSAVASVVQWDFGEHVVTASKAIQVKKKKGVV